MCVNRQGDGTDVRARICVRVQTLVDFLERTVAWVALWHAGCRDFDIEVAILRVIYALLVALKSQDEYLYGVLGALSDQTFDVDLVEGIQRSTILVDEGWQSTCIIPRHAVELLLRAELESLFVHDPRALAEFEVERRLRIHLPD